MIHLACAVRILTIVRYIHVVVLPRVAYFREWATETSLCVGCGFHVVAYWHGCVARKDEEGNFARCSLSLHFVRKQCRESLQKVSVRRGECRRLVTIDIDFAKDLPIPLNGHDNFRPRFQAAARYRGSALTSSTISVCPVEAAAPQMPWSRGMRT